MTTTAPDVDTTTLDALDWQHQQPCTFASCEYGHPPAAWRIAWCCACVSLACQPCTDDLRGWIDDWRGTVVIGTCANGCGYSAETLAEDLARFTPLS